MGDLGIRNLDHTFYAALSQVGLPSGGSKETFQVQFELLLLHIKEIKN